MLSRLHRLRLTAVCVFTVLVSICVHEAGHALAGVLTGSRIRNVVIFSLRPHVTLERSTGPEHTAVKAAAGSVAFLAFWSLVVLLAPAGATAGALFCNALRGM